MWWTKKVLSVYVKVLLVSRIYILLAKSLLFESVQKKLLFENDKARLNETLTTLYCFKKGLTQNMYQLLWREISRNYLRLHSTMSMWRIYLKSSSWCWGLLMKFVKISYQIRISMNLWYSEEKRNVILIRGGYLWSASGP